MNVETFRYDNRIARAFAIATVIWGLVGFSAGLLIGCGSGGQERRTDTVKTSAAVSVDVTKAKQDLDGVLSELKNLRDASDTADLKKMQGDLRKKSSQFTDSVTSVVNSSACAEHSPFRDLSRSMTESASTS